ncbi:putative 4-hydroxy-4-methyl-2-oxoglutarate aldolase [Shewanella cyperi]|uniref:putative 4-hydroxy-4-methyl-2-oxoglutarate aldolase n=1 Tax=Shewanella cyperi TaxID=2814292 RepID=UPI001A951D49|nr:putative 4-hydroxy-4-methyl-2-oxoglutarate aldolase [Shewanella cyperi]QSX42354.1 putative 4-hydroxy-4-methyl-2-oxoglutarate aldolase [Shewanella cyperi]
MLDLLPDLFDSFPDELTLLPATWQHFGCPSPFWGEIVTVRCFEDNSRVKELLATPGQGKVLVVDGGASLKRALLGDMIAESAQNNGWAGVIIYGAVRDVATLRTLSLGIKALGVVPIKTDRRGLGETDVVLDIAGVAIEPGWYLYADENGVAVSRELLSITGA